MAPLLGGPMAGETAEPTLAKKVVDIVDTKKDTDNVDDADDGGDETSIERDSSAAPPHPLGVKPLGNKYLSSVPDAKLSAGLFGGYFPDEIVMMLLESLDATSLRLLGSTCRFLYAFCSFDELWKALAKNQLAAWHGTWRASFLEGSRTTTRPQVKINTHVFSDVLHRPFVCSHADPARFARGIPRANQIRSFADLSYDEFSSKYSSTPFVLTNSCVRKWPVLDWTLVGFTEKYSSTPFRAESVDWPYWLYNQYMQNTGDESPLYLFDKKFAEKMGLNLGDTTQAPDVSEASEASETPETAKSTLDYWKPDCFGSDLFEVLGPQRPAHRWLIIGPARSGSTFHKDPNGTSAWNAVVRGAKYWIMFPPGAQVPGVYVSADKSEVTSPLSIAEWLLTFHEEARETPGCIEGVCGEGEILHVPSGWWHLVVNLEAGIALTQNFVPRAHLADVLLFLRDRPEQVTGFAREDVKDPYALFVERLRVKYPGVLAEAEAEIERRDSRRKRTWESVVRGEPAAANDRDTAEGEDGKRPKSEGGGFTFGFGFGDDDLDDDEIP